MSHLCLQFERPENSSYIRVYEADTNNLLLGVDVANSSDVTYNSINRTIMVTFNYNFDIDKDYYVTIPSGTILFWHISHTNLLTCK